LTSAVRDVFGARALIQRCREHKKRNVTDALPRAMRTAMRQVLNQAYATRDVNRTQALLEHQARQQFQQPNGHRLGDSLSNDTKACRPPCRAERSEASRARERAAPWPR